MIESRLRAACARRCARALSVPDGCLHLSRLLVLPAAGPSVMAPLSSLNARMGELLLFYRFFFLFKCALLGGPRLASAKRHERRGMRALAAADPLTSSSCSAGAKLAQLLRGRPPATFLARVSSILFIFIIFFFPVQLCEGRVSGMPDGGPPFVKQNDARRRCSHYMHGGSWHV